VASKEIGREVSADKTKYIVMFRDQNAGQSHSVKTDNSSFERVEEFKYLGTTLTNRNSIPEEIKSRLKPVNACYHSVQNLLSSSLLSKTLKINFHFRKIHRQKKEMCYQYGARVQCNPGSPSFRVYFLSVIDGRRKLL